MTNYDNAVWVPGDDEAWRGDVHLADWPEELAGPEYWMYRNASTV